MTVRLFNFVILHLLYDIFFVVVTICVFCHDGNKGFTYLLTFNACIPDIETLLNLLISEQNS